MASRRDPLPEPLFGWALLALALGTAFPLGGHRPALWMIQSSITFFLCGGLLLAAAFRGGRFPAGPGNHGRPDLNVLLALGLAWAFAMILLQILPGAGLLQIPSSLDAQSSLVGGLRHLGITAFGFAVLQAFRRRQRAGMTALLLLCGIVLHAAYGFLGLRLSSLHLPGEIAYPGFLTGAFVNRNSFATYIGIGLVLSLSLLFSPLPWRKSKSEGADAVMWRAGLAVAAIFLTTALLATGSRMGLIATFAGVGVLGFAMMLGNRTRRGAGLLLLAPALAVPFLLVAGSGPLFDRMLDLGENAESRIALYHATLKMIADAPFLGVGLDNFSQEFRFYQDLTVSPDFRWNDAHSTYLENWAELGLIIGSLPILIGLAVFKLLAARIRQSGGRDPLPLAAIAALTLGALHTGVDFSLEIQGVLLPLVLLIGLALAPAPQIESLEVKA